MNRNTVSFLAVVLLSSACLAQNSADTKASASVPLGTTVQAELIKAVDAKKAKPGDEMECAKVTKR